jgi:hypothetical protein
MLNNPMNNVMNMLDTNVDVEYFNDLLVKRGGKPIKINEKKINMRDFILKLIKTFRKDFNKKMKKGGTIDLFTDSAISPYIRYGNLSFDSYTHPPITLLERDLL